MKKTVVAYLLPVLCFCMLTTNVFAVAVGPYVDLSKGSGEFEYDRASTSFDIDARSGAVGFVLDTAPTNESVFNYRLNVGVARQDIEDNFGSTLELTGLAIENVFGFALVREPGLRWWVGPLVDVGFYGGESDDGSIKDVGVFELGIGAATGMNFRAGRNVIIAPSIGFRLTGADGNGKIAGVKEDFSAGFTTGFVNLAVLFD
jgi:hypothetical protein